MELLIITMKIICKDKYTLSRTLQFELDTPASHVIEEIERAKRSMVNTLSGEDA